MPTQRLVDEGGDLELDALPHWKPVQLADGHTSTRIYRKVGATRPAVTFLTAEHGYSVVGNKFYWLATEAHVREAFPGPYSAAPSLRVETVPCW